MLVLYSGKAYYRRLVLVNVTSLEVIKPVHAQANKVLKNKDCFPFKILRCCIYPAHNVKIPTIVGILTFNSKKRYCIYTANNVKMPTIVDILTFNSRKKFHAQLS